MSEADDLLSQADALMRRHRSFIARAPAEAPPSQSEAAEADIPLLTEVVAAAPLFAPHPDALATQLGAALSDWLAERLPAAFASASEQLLAELDSQARATLLPRLAEIIAHHRRQADH